MVLHHQGNERLQIEGRSLQGLKQLQLLILHSIDALCQVGPRKLNGLTDHFQLFAFPGLYIPQSPHSAETQQVSQRLCIPGMVDILVQNRIDIPGAALQEQSDSAIA